MYTHTPQHRPPLPLINRRHQRRLRHRLRVRAHRHHHLPQHRPPRRRRRQHRSVRTSCNIICFSKNVCLCVCVWVGGWIDANPPTHQHQHHNSFIGSDNHNLKYLGVKGLAAIVKDHPRYAAQHQVTSTAHTWPALALSLSVYDTCGRGSNRITHTPHVCIFRHSTLPTPTAKPTHIHTHPKKNQKTSWR